MDTTQQSPFGGAASHVATMSTQKIISMYRRKCGADVSRSFDGIDAIGLYECGRTHMRFWRPASIAGDEAFYKDLSARWPEYYRTDRWEYQPARAAIVPGSEVLEVGCGRGYFLRSIEGLAGRAVGLELNNEAIRQKVTRFDVRSEMIGSYAESAAETFDAVCSFQVLEHVADPAGFIRDCLACIKPGGRLILSTPNYDWPVHRERRDAFDLPPHHLNHFDAGTYRSVATLFGLEVDWIDTQQMSGSARFALNANAGPAAARFAKRQANRLISRMYSGKESLGHTIVAVLRRRETPANGAH